MWENEPAEVKKYFSDLAWEEKERHAAQFPGWKCTPRNSKNIKRRAKKMRALAVVQTTVPATPATPSAPQPSPELVRNAIRVNTDFVPALPTHLRFAGSFPAMANQLQVASAPRGSYEELLPQRDLSWIEHAENDFNQLGPELATQYEQMQGLNEQTHFNLSTHLDMVATQVNGLISDRSIPSSHDTDNVDASGNVCDRGDISGDYWVY